MNGFDLENPLRVDDCQRCLAVHWRDCVCSPAAPRRIPNDEQIELARQERLTRAERRGAA